MQSSLAESIQEIHSIINNRITKAPPFIKNNFRFKYRNQKTIIMEIGSTIFVALLSPNEIKNIKWRQKKGITDFPGLITEDVKNSIFRIENANNIMLSNVSIQDGYAFSVGPNSSAIIECVSIHIPKTHAGPIKYTVDLGFIIRPPTENSLYSLTEKLDDLIVCYIKNIREAKHDLSI